MCTSPESADRTAATIPESTRTSTPDSRSRSVTSSAANRSTRGNSPASRTISVTCDPSACHAVAISVATTPPPRIASRAGTSFALVASRLVHGRSSSRPGSGGSAADVPVQTATACRAVSSSTSPSGVVTVTCFGPASRPCPRIRLIPALSSHATCPASSQSLAMRSRCRSTAAASRGWSAAASRPGTPCRSLCSSTGRRSALLGSQAQYEHSPPTSSASTTTVSRPAAVVRSATFSPTGPAPITMTSKVRVGLPGMAFSRKGLSKKLSERLGKRLSRGGGGTRGEPPPRQSGEFRRATAQRPGARCEISCRNHGFPSGSSNDAKLP